MAAGLPSGRTLALTRMLGPSLLLALALTWTTVASGAITFAPSPHALATATATAREIVVVDLDRDGWLDVVAASVDCSLLLLRNDGTPFDGPWTVHAAATFGTTEARLTVADLDGDGWPDIVTSNGAGEIRVWRNDQSPFVGAWLQSTLGDVGGPDGTFLACADFDRDGDVDVASQTGWNQSNVARVWENDGTPFDGPWSGGPISSGGARNGLLAGDLDGDGFPDLVFSQSEYYPHVHRNDGTPFDGGWTSVNMGWGGPGGVGIAALADFDGDGDLDVATTCGYQPTTTQYVWRNDGTPFNGGWASTGFGSSPANEAEAADFDRDGWIDLFSVSSGGEDFEAIAWTNDAAPFDGGWPQVDVGTTGSSLHGVASGDLDRDGDLDVVTGGDTSAEWEIVAWRNLAQLTRIAARPPETCITPAHPCVEVPVEIELLGATPVRGVSVVLTISPDLQLCGDGIEAGDYLGGWTEFHVLDMGGGAYTVDFVTMGEPCGATGNGRIFTLNLASSAPSGMGTVVVDSVILRDCGNLPMAAFAGPPAFVPIDNTAPAAIADLAAVQQTSANDPDGTTKILLNLTAPADAASVRLYRAGWGPYPEYDDVGGGVPATPSYEPGAPWSLAATLTTPVTSYVDELPWPERGFWYYVAFAVDACGNVSAVSNQTTGTLNYHLGDVSNGTTQGVGNNRVYTEDLSLLGLRYGTTLVPDDPFNYLDVGPTTDWSAQARPLTDNRVQFEDLMVFALNFDGVSAPQDAATAPVAGATDRLWVEGPDQAAAGEVFAASVRLSGAGELHGLSVTLDWDRAVVEPVGYEAGGLVVGQGGLVLSPAPGTVDAALLGAGGGLRGEGELAAVTFRALRAGEPRITLRSVDARDGWNRKVVPAGVAPPAPLVTAFAPPGPNPFSRVTALSFSLAKAGEVELAIFSVDGRKVATIAQGVREAGEHRFVWEGAGARPGLYFARLTTPDGHFRRTLVLTR